MYVTIEDNTGLHEILVGNVITNLGENQTGIRCFDNATYVGCQWISLSNDATPVQTWTKLPNETTTLGAGRNKATLSAAWMNSNDYSRNITKKFTFTGSIQLQCAGAQWSPTASSDNNLYACAAFTQTTFEANWNLTITWAFTYNGN